MARLNDIVELLMGGIYDEADESDRGVRYLFNERHLGDRSRSNLIVSGQLAYGHPFVIRSLYLGGPGDTLEKWKDVPWTLEVGGTDLFKPRPLLDLCETVSIVETKLGWRFMRWKPKNGSLEILPLQVIHIPLRYATPPGGPLHAMVRGTYTRDVL